MANDRWQRLKHILGEVLQHPPETWPKWLASHCGDDLDLFLDIAVILARSRTLGDFIEHPVWRLLPDTQEAEELESDI